MDLDKLRVLVLNSDGMPLDIICWQKGIILVHLKKSVHELDFYADYKIRDGHGRAYPVPAVIMKKRHVKKKYNVVCRKRNIVIRDNFTCQYCKEVLPAKDLTIDHVIPTSEWKKSREGSSTVWSNVVASCVSCNRRKANKSCEKAGMHPLKSPVQPTYAEIALGLHSKSKIPDEWKPYIAHLPVFSRRAND